MYLRLTFIIQSFFARPQMFTPDGAKTDRTQKCICFILNKNKNIWYINY